MIECPVCSGKLSAARLKCVCCQVEFEGDFNTPRLTRLTREQQKFVEAFILCGGNLKELSSLMNVSYPTLRKQLDALILEMKNLKSADENLIESLLDDMEKGRLSADKGLRQIKELNGEL